jgi:hypothetical protein
MTPDTDFLCGYSPLTGSSSLFNLLKNLERSSIFAVIAGSFGLGWSITSVARSQVYRKSCYLKMGGFSGIGDQRSGDDDLLLQKMSPIIRRHNFIFDPGATVISNDKTSLNDHVNLETRRASKWKLYPLSIKLLTLFIFIYYLMLIYLLAALLTGNISLLSFCFIHLIKTGAEFILLAVFLYRIKRFKQLIVFPLAEILYIPYYIIFGLKGTFGKYQWKA